MVIDLSYGRSVAVRAKNLWRGLREMLYGQGKEGPEPLDPNEDDELKRLREELASLQGAEERWLDQRKNLQREVDRLWQLSVGLTRLQAIEKALLSDAGGGISSHEHTAGYFCHLATQIQEQYPGAANHLRRIARTLVEIQG